MSLPFLYRYRRLFRKAASNPFLAPKLAAPPAAPNAKAFPPATKAGMRAASGNKPPR